ncbi:MAG: ATPase, T2SS/T4P/T4SS family [Gammaproteobacteria bacterium]
MVLRILDPESAKLGIDMLGYEEDQKQLYLDALNQPQGMILVTGPTGSGKTVSLYTGLNIIIPPSATSRRRKTPPKSTCGRYQPRWSNEHQNQDNLQRRTAAFLRQDPDVVMVGEIRDLETAEEPSRQRKPVTWCCPPCTPTAPRRP